MMKRITRKRLFKLVKEAVIFGVLWEVFLTPIYMLLFGMTLATFLNETIIEFTMVTPLAPVVYAVAKFLLRKWGEDK